MQGSRRARFFHEQIRSTLIGENNTSILNHGADQVTASKPDSSSSQLETLSLPTLLPSTYEDIKSDRSVSTISPYNSEITIISSMSQIELSVDIMTTEFTNDAVSTNLIPSCRILTPRRVMSTTTTPKTKVTYIKKSERKINARTKLNNEGEDQLTNGSKRHRLQAVKLITN